MAYLGVDGWFDGFHAFVGELNTAPDIPSSLAELGVVNPDPAAILAGVLKGLSCGGNPVEMTAENMPSSSPR